MIYNACRHGQSLEGSTVYIAGLPTCEECWKGLVQVGVARVVMPEVETAKEEWIEGCKKAVEYMEEAGVEVYQYNPWQFGWGLLDTELPE